MLESNTNYWDLESLSRYTPREEFDAVHRLARVVIDYTDSLPHIKLKDLSSSMEPSPFLDRQVRGVLLEMDCNTPAYLWTRWGKWQILHTQGRVMNEDLDGLIDTLNARVHREEYYVKESYSNEYIGPIGPIYFVHGKWDLELEIPEVRYLREPDFSALVKNIKEWRELTDMYNAQTAEPVTAML